MFPMRHGRRIITILALLLAVLSLGSPAQALGGGPGILILDIHEYILGNPKAGGFTDATRAQSWCMKNGGVTASDPGKIYTQAMADIIINHGYDHGTSFYTGGTADPSTKNPNLCYESKVGSYNSSNCFYRWIYGFYDQFSYYGEVGTAFWEGMHRFDVDPDHAVLNGYSEYQWNTTYSYPHGKFYIINSYNKDDLMLYRSDCSSYAYDCVQPREKFVMMCEVQLYPMNSPVSKKDPQPIFVKEWEELTWAQANWFLIYIVFLIIILSIFLLISVYCWITSRAKPVGKMITPMVIREYQGFPFVVDNENDSAGGVQFPLNHWDPANSGYGFGGLPSGDNQAGDPQENSPRNPLIVEAPDVNQYGNGKRYSGRESGQDVELEGPQETESSHPAYDPNSSRTSQCPQREMKLEKSNSGRHTRKNRSSLCVFSEVDLPDANEVHETNVELRGTFKKR